MDSLPFHILIKGVDHSFVGQPFDDKSIINIDDVRKSSSFSKYIVDLEVKHHLVGNTHSYADVDIYTNRLADYWNAMYDNRVKNSTIIIQTLQSLFDAYCSDESFFKEPLDILIVNEYPRQFANEYTLELMSITITRTFFQKLFSEKDLVNAIHSLSIGHYVRKS